MPREARSSPGHTVQGAARRAGLTVDVLRAWERRHRAVTPRRTRGRRVYSDADVERLVLLRCATRAGHGIGAVAGLSNAALARLLQGDERAPGDARDDARTRAPRALPSPAMSRTDGEAERIAADALAAVRALDGATLDQVLVRGCLTLGDTAFLEQVVEPLHRRLRAAGRAGELRPARLHLASATLRTFLGAMKPSSPAASDAPLVVVATPCGQPDELGALAAALAASAAGWRTLHLAPGLAADEIAAAAHARSAAAVLLDLADGQDTVTLAGELRRLRRLLPAETPLLVGGASERLGKLLRDLGARRLGGVADVRDALAGLRP